MFISLDWELFCLLGACAYLFIPSTTWSADVTCLCWQFIKPEKLCNSDVRCCITLTSRDFVDSWSSPRSCVTRRLTSSAWWRTCRSFPTPSSSQARRCAPRPTRAASEPTVQVMHLINPHNVVFRVFCGIFLAHSWTFQYLHEEQKNDTTLTVCWYSCVTQYYRVTQVSSRKATAWAPRRASSSRRSAPAAATSRSSSSTPGAYRRR